VSSTPGWLGGMDRCSSDVEPGVTVQAGGESDGELLDRAMAGDREAFMAILHRHDARLRCLAAKLLHGDRHRLDDALQEAYARAYRALPGFRRDADVGTWLYRITYNACIDELRRAGRRPEPVDPSDMAWDRPAPGAEPDAVVSTADTIHRALANLPPEQRGALVLVLGEGFDQPTAAQILGVPVGTIASRVSRARATIRRVLEEEHA
jgi:RNA polymerase sigma-70 factor (ECF subfamily)